ncbi:MAG: uroporphyrinogen-III synthase [Bacteroidaceae bacterium]|nr:uroporphyrinogen-III synthase [Bacteroidaceae bacterium]
MIKKILVSQPKPSSEKSPYYDIADRYEVEIVFRPFIKVEKIPSLEFRKQKVNILNYTAVVFTSRHAIDSYFQIAKENHQPIPEDMKFFCVTETISLYIQKYIPYRKRKVFFSPTGKIEDLVVIMQKHKSELYLVPLSDVHDSTIKSMLDGKKLKHTECVMYRTLSNDFTEEEIAQFDYDMCVFFSPSGIASFEKNVPEEIRNKVAVATFGPATTKAAHDAQLNVVVEAPTEKYPSMTGALNKYLRDLEDDE